MLKKFSFPHQNTQRSGCPAGFVPSTAMQTLTMKNGVNCHLNQDYRAPPNNGVPLHALDSYLLPSCVIFTSILSSPLRTSDSPQIHGHQWIIFRGITGIRVSVFGPCPQDFGSLGRIYIYTYVCVSSVIFGTLQGCSGRSKEISNCSNRFSLHCGDHDYHQQN